MWEIKELNQQTELDYYNLFENGFFMSDTNCACYCTCWNISEKEIKSEIEDPVREGKTQMREIGKKTAGRLIRDGILKGYLVYNKGVPIGWGNVNDKSKYTNLGTPEPMTPTMYGITKSIVCFKIVPEYRCKGVASYLLNHICQEAAIQGYSYVEAYPNTNNLLSTNEYQYLLQMYRKAGFVEVRSSTKYSIQQKQLLS